MRVESEGRGTAGATRSGRGWRVVVGLLVLASLVAMDPGRQAGAGGSPERIAVGCPSPDVDGDDGDAGLTPLWASVPLRRRVDAPPRGCAPVPGTPRAALVAHHLVDCGRDSCSGTTLPPPSPA